MKTSQLLRNELGLSQQALAIYLSIPVSQLAMYETGKRELPAAASIQIAKLFILLNQSKENKKVTHEVKAKQQLEVVELLKTQAKELEYQLLKEQRKLETMQKKFKQHLNLMALTDVLPKSKQQHNELFFMQAHNSLKKNSLVNQTQQLVKIEGINSQLQFITKLIENKG
jgi:transcriptional regulator with XRE-family HTH domain